MPDGVATIPPSTDDELPSGTVAGEYRIECTLGRGGMGTVYGARHPVIGKRAAIKVINGELSASREAVDRFVLEAQAVNQIGHPNIVDVFAFGALADGRSFFVMEWLEGETLRARLRRPIALEEAVDILIEISAALVAAHEAGVMHRDLKPDNVFLVRRRTGPPDVKLLDFGLAKLHHTTSGRVDHTRTGMVMGTPLYLSPEQAKGVRVDFATDVYSLGAIAYEMCAGRVPFTAESAVEIMAKHISEPVGHVSELAPHVPLALDTLLFAMLDKDPQRRPSIVHVSEHLGAIRASIAAAKPAATTAPSHVAVAAAPAYAPASARSRRVVIAAVAAIIVVGGIAGYFVFRDTSTERTVTASEVASPPIAPPPVATPPPVVKPAPTEPVPVPAEPSPPIAADPKPTETAARPAPVRTGTVVVSIDGAPRGRIFVDGKIVAQGVAKTTLELPPGEHRIRAEAKQRLPAVEVVHVAAGATSTIRLAVKPRPNAVLDWDDDSGSAR